MKSFILFFALLLICKICIAEENFRTWIRSDGRTIEAKFVEQNGNEIKIKNEEGRIITIPLDRLSKSDQDYAKKASLQNFFRIPQAFQYQGKGGIIIASAIGNVNVIEPSLYSGSSKLKPIIRSVVVGESIPHGYTILTGNKSETNLLLTTGSLVKVGSNSKLFNAFWQKNFLAPPKK